MSTAQRNLNIEVSSNPSKGSKSSKASKSSKSKQTRKSAASQQPSQIKQLNVPAEVLDKKDPSRNKSTITIADNIKSLMKTHGHAEKERQGAKIPKARKPAVGMGMGGPVQRTNIPELDATIEDLKLIQNDFQKLVELKGMIDVHIKVKSLLEMLEEAQKHLKDKDQIGKNISEQGAFLAQLEQTREYAENFKKQVEKYNDANVLKKKFIQDDVRMKIKAIGESFSMQTFQLQAFYVQPITNPSEITETNHKISEALLQSLSSMHHPPSPNSRGFHKELLSQSIKS